MNDVCAHRIQLWRNQFVRSVYATHNESPKIRKAVRRLLSQIGSGGRGLNVGAGSSQLHPALINVDIVPGPTIEICASVEDLPFPDETFDLVVSQEVRLPSRSD